MNSMIITSAKYNKDNRTNANCSISCVVGGEHLSVPLDLANRHYAEIMRQVEAGELTITPPNGV